VVGDLSEVVGTGVTAEGRDIMSSPPFGCGSDLDPSGRASASGFSFLNHQWVLYWTSSLLD